MQHPSPEKPNIEEKILERAALQLENLGLSWKEIEGKTILDVGAGDAYLESATSLQGNPVKVFSFDLKFPQGPTTPENFAIADASRPPFLDETFDLILAHASGTQIFSEGRYLLKEGGEMRQYPLYGYDADCMFYYLVAHKGYSEEEASTKLEELYRKNEEHELAEYGVCKEWADLDTEAREKLSDEEKLALVEPLVERWAAVVELPLEYEIVSWAHDQPKVVLIYRKGE